MIDHQQSVDEIRSFLHSSDQTLTDAVSQLASVYVTACQEVNARLRRCGDLLQQGLRSEAIHLAQAEPILLDDLAILDFPERSEWEEVSLAYGLPAPPKLNLDAAEALNVAYADTLPLDNLLREHRLLALSRAPLVQRLSILRRISALDAKNPVWAEDIQTFEKARFEQLDKEAKEAVAGNNVARVAALADEVARTKWLAEPPRALTTYVELAASRFHRKKLRERLENLEQKLNEAHSAFDVTRARMLRAQWEEISREADLALEHPLRDRVSPALAWLEKEDRKEVAARRFQALVGELKSALDEGASRDILESRYAAATVADMDLPGALEERYHEHIRHIILAQRWRRIRLLAISAASVIVLVGILAFWIYQTNQAKKASQAEQTLKAMLEANQFEEARSFWDKLAAKEPGIAKCPRFAELQGVLVDLEEKEQQRITSFRQSVVEAETEISENPDSQALAKAKTLVRLPEEKTAVTQLEARAKEEAWRKQKTLDEALVGHLNECCKKLKQLETEVSVSFESAAVSALDSELSKDCETLMREAKTVSPPERHLVEEFQGRLMTLRASVDRQKLEKSFMERLTNSLQAAQTVDKYASVATEYIKTFPQSPRSEAFKSALKERNLWDATLAWGALIEPWLAKPFGLPAKECKGYVEKCEEFIRANPGIFFADSAKDFSRCVEAMSQQDQEQTDGSAAKLRNLFSSLVIRNLWAVQTEDGKVYYVRKDPKDDIELAQNGSGFINVLYIYSFDGKERSKPVKLADISRSGRAPQSEIAGEFRELSGRLSKQGWDAFIIDLAKSIQAKKEMDPVLKLSLLKTLLEHGAKASYPLALALSDCNVMIKKSQVDLTIPWIDPNYEAIATRRDAKDLLNKLPMMEIVQRRCAENKRKLESSVARSRFVPVGWLARTKGSWQCLSRKTSDSGEICVVLPKGECQSIGTLVEGKPTIGQVGSEALVEGRVVFFRKSQPR